MTIKENLKRYRSLKLDLEDVDMKINSKTVKDNAQGSMKDYPFILQNHTVVGVPSEEYSLLEEKSDLEAQIKEVETFVESIKDYKVRKAIKIYYINPLEEDCEKTTWKSIAEKFNDGTTENSIKKSVNRFLNSFS